MCVHAGWTWHCGAGRGIGGRPEGKGASADAPERNLQEGYNIDLLEDGRKNNNIRSTTTTPPPVPVLSIDHPQAEAGGYTTAPGPTRNGYASVAPPTPWYKTRKWLIIFLVGGVAIVAAVVGGAVGGTVGKAKSSEPAQSTNPEAGGGGAVGPGQTSGGGEQSPATTSEATGTAPVGTTNIAATAEGTGGVPIGSAGTGRTRTGTGIALPTSFPTSTAATTTGDGGDPAGGAAL